MPSRQRRTTGPVRCALPWGMEDVMIYEFEYKFHTWERTTALNIVPKCQCASGERQCCCTATCPLASDERRRLCPDGRGTGRA